MRIIGGAAKGRKLSRPVEGTRPFTDRNREALFSSLGPSVIEASVLDLFAGVGALGLEALSRGAAHATFVEWNPLAVTVLRENVAAVGLGGEVVAGDVADFLASTKHCYDLIFVDPPFDLDKTSLPGVLGMVATRTKPGGVVVVHRRFGEAAPVTPVPLTLSWERRYGDSQIWRFTMGAQEDDQ